MNYLSRTEPKIDQNAYKLVQVVLATKQYCASIMLTSKLVLESSLTRAN